MLASAFAGSTLAQAQTPSWNMYQPYKHSTFVPFVSALSSTTGAQVNLAVGPSGNMSSPQAVTMDTGSIGIQVSTDKWNPGSLTPIGPGSITLNSSGVTNSGNFYSVPVNFFAGGTGDTNVATANVPVLVVTQSTTCPPGGGSCTTVNDPRGVFYMGVGLNRTAGENLVTPNAQLVNGQTLNPFLNITQIPGLAVSASTIRQGYIINTANGATGGVTLGLTQQNTQGMSFVKLGANASGSLDNWNTAPMSVTVTNGGQSSTASSGANPPSGSGVLPDAGINYMFLSPVPSNVVTQSCTLSGGTRNCLPDGAQVQVSLPGSGAASGLAQYSFTVGGTGSNVVQPAAVATLPGSAFVNTGREFFLGFQYLYDSVGGYVGYAAQPGLGASGSVNLGVALIGQVGLADKFSNSLPVFLIGDTTLAQTGSGSITSAIAGSFGLTIGSGSVTLVGANTYTGGTTVAAGASLTGTTSSLQGNIVDNGSVTFSQATAGTYAGNISGIGSVGITGGGTIIFSGTNSYTGGTTVSGGVLQGTTTSLQGNIANNAAVQFNQSTAGTYAGVISGSGTVGVTGGGMVLFTGANSYSGGTFVSGATLQGIGTSLQGSITNSDRGITQLLQTATAGNATITNNNIGGTEFWDTSTAGRAVITNNAFGLTFFADSSTAGSALITNATASNAAGQTTFANTSSAGNATISNAGGFTFFFDSSTARNANITNVGQTAFTNFSNTSSAGNATISNSGGSTFFLDSSTAGNATITTNAGSSTQFQHTSTAGNATITTNTGGAFIMSGLTSAGMTAGSIAGGGSYDLGSKSLTVGSNNLSTEVSGAISGIGGSLVKQGAGTLTLSGANSYTGGTTVAGGTMNLTGSMTGSLSILSGATFTTTGSWTLTPGASFSNAGTFQSLGGAALVNQGTLVNNGTLTTNLVNSGILSGTGTINGTVTNNGIAAPGNSIGTLNVVGAFTHAASATYQVETTGAGQTDRINVSGAPGTATLAGGTVTLTAASGVYAPSTTYTILNATGGVTGTFANANSLFPFLQPSLSYDANNVFLTLKPGGFGAGAATPNQAAVGRVLDASVAGSSGDLATVIGTMATYTSAQGQAAMNAISGQNYSGFGTANLGGGLLFMNALGQQMSAARGTGNRESRTALAMACDVACDAEAPSPWSLWATGMGGTGSVAGNGNAGTLTYNAGGFATGVDYRFDPRFLAGVGVGFSSGNQWASGFSGQGTTNSYQASLYASFTQAAFYLDGMAGYGYNDNQMTRQIVLPNLAARTAQGRTGANQFLGQVEAGYRVGLHEPAALSITPFARFQGLTNSQNGFSESGAGALNLNVAAQTTGSARSVLGAEFAGAFGTEGSEKLAVQMRLGWAHEYANTARPVTAAFAGAPGQNFTVFGAAPQRDTATFSLAANTAVAQGVSLYARYDGEMGNGISSHALNGGLRVSW